MRYSILTASCLLITASAIPSNLNLYARHKHSKGSHGSHDDSTDAAVTTSSGTVTSTLTTYVSEAPYGIGNATAILPTGTGTGLFQPQSASPSAKQQDGVDSNANEQAAPGSKGSGTGSPGPGSAEEGSSKNDALGGEQAANVDNAVKHSACVGSTVTITKNSYVTVTVPAGGAAAPSPVKSEPLGEDTKTGKVESVSPSKQQAAQSSAQADEASPSTQDSGPTKDASSDDAGTEPAEDDDSPSKPANNDDAAKPTTSPTPAEDDDSPSKPANNDDATKPNTSSSPAEDDTATAAPSNAPANNAPAAGGAPFRTKRGIIASGDVQDSLAAAFTNSKVSWLGNWYSEAPKSMAKDLTFVPQNYGKQSDIKGEWTKNAEKAVAAGTKYMLSFGEPGTENEKLFMTPAEGAQLWKEKMDPYAKQGVTIGAPGTLQNTKDFDWLKEFLDLCNDCTIGFLAMHWYWKATEAQDLKDMLGRAKEIAGGRKIWLSNFQAGGDLQAQKEFLGEVVPWLEAQDYIAAYAYVPTAIQNGGDPGMTDGDKLNELGQYYANL